MNIERVVAHQAIPLSRDEFVTPDAQPFDMTQYSLTKHGDGMAARAYGIDIAEALVAQVPDAVVAEKAVMTVPACVYAPKPARAVACGALTWLNRYRALHDIEPIKELRTYTDRMGTSAYAQATPEERSQARASWTDERHVPRSLVEGAVVFAVDDCIVTGNAEKDQVANLEPFAPARIICAYAIEVDHIEAGRFQGVEDAMNMAANPTLDTVQQLIEQGRFALNSRVLSLILRADLNDLDDFFANCEPMMRGELLEAAVNSTLEYQSRYPSALARLTQAVVQDY